MRIKVMNKFLKLILSDNILAITLCPFGIYLKNNNQSVRTINHEKIHWKQQLEMLVIFFYIWYILEWLIKYFKYGKYAYYKISFEQEAYTYDDNLNYLKNRKIFTWMKFIFK